MKIDSVPRIMKQSRSAGFTLMGLAAVIATIALLAVTYSPAFAVTKSRSRGTICQNNLRQLMQAFLLYSTDFSGFLPPNPDDGNTIPGFNWCPGQAGRGGSQEFNSDLLHDPPRSILLPYGADQTLFKCPEDRRMGKYQGSDKTLRGQTVPAARTISMNNAIGTDPYPPSNGKLPTNGPWLDNSHSNTRTGKWQTYGRLSDLSNPGPAKTWVLMDEDDRSINDGHFAFGMQISEWIDGPGGYHNKSGSLVFADGHGELHHWLDPRTIFTGTSFTRKAAPNSVDWKWIADRTSALKVR